MAPSDTPKPIPKQAVLATEETNDRAVPRQEIQSSQPGVPQGMDTQKPHDENLELRGGDRGGCCPGRFCFCIPCPLPCDFCII